MIITVWNNYSKRYNSTARPTGGTDITVNFKSPTSKENPVFELSYQNAFDINYVKWNDHYYFVSNVVYTAQGLYEIYCSEDKLATYRDAILSLNTYVKRSAHTYDLSIPDDHITQKQALAQTKVTTANIPNRNAAGCYIIRCSGTNGITTYAITKAQLDSIMAFSYSSSVWDGIRDLGANTMFDPFSHILSLKWMPFGVNTLGSSDTQIVMLGRYNTGVTANIALSGYIDYITLTMPDSSYTGFRKYSSAWSSLTLYLPGTGIISLDPINMQTGVKIRMIVDTNTGQVTYKLYHDNEIAQDQGLITSVSGVIASDIQINNIQTNTNQFLSSVVGVIAGVATATATSGATAAAAGVGAAASGIGAISALTKGTTSINGNNGNMTLLMDDLITLTLTQLKTSDDIDTDEVGRPLYKLVTLSVLANKYVECYRPSVNLAGLEDDRRFINNMLESGVYLD